MRIKGKMHYSSGLEYIVGNSYSNVSYFSKNLDDNYSFKSEDSATFTTKYTRKTHNCIYKNHEQYIASYITNHTFASEIFLNPSRPKTRFIGDNSEIKSMVEETFELMMKEKLKGNISINVLPFDDFKVIHSTFGSWNNGILGFSINGNDKQVFVRENYLDALMLVIGHEIGHVLTGTLANKHDEEAKAFAFSIEWAKTIKEHNIANLGMCIKDELDFNPAKNGLHDVAFSFVDFMVKKGRKAMQLHDDLARKYVSVFNALYYPK